jgi:uncharacterized membrane protein YfcA
MRAGRAQALFMSHALIPVVWATLIFVLAGAVKGVAGLGLPTVAIGLLGLLMPPGEAAALLIVPSLITNIWQFVAGPHRLRILRRLWLMLTAIIVATWATAGLIANSDGSDARTALGIALIVYAATGLVRIRLNVPLRLEPWLSPVIGAVTGAITGATGVFVIPAVPYLQALGLEKEDLVQALGLSFTASTLALAAGLASHAAFPMTAAGASALYTVPALIGTLLGQWVRLRVDPATFRLVFFIGLLVLGADLALHSLL